MRIIVGAALLLATATAFAQRVPLGIPGLGALGHSGEALTPEGEQNAFTDAGKRDGDDKLTCDQLHAELTTIQESPELQTLAASSEQGSGDQGDGAANQTQQLLESLQIKQPSMIGMAARGVAQSLNPFGGIGARRRGARQQAEMEAKLADIQKAFQPWQSPTDAAGPFGGLAAGMPMLMRMNRVRALANQQKCDWAADLPSLDAAEPTQGQR